MKLAIAVANSLVNSTAKLLNGGSIRLFDVDGNILAAPKFAAEAFGGASAGAAAANDIESDPDAAKTGRAVSYALVTSNGEIVGEGKAGDAKDAENDPEISLVLTAPNIQQHAEVMIDGYVLKAE